MINCTIWLPQDCLLCEEVSAGYCQFARFNTKEKHCSRHLLRTRPFPMKIRSCGGEVRENSTTRAAICGKADGKTVSGLSIGKTGEQYSELFLLRGIYTAASTSPYTPRNIWQRNALTVDWWPPSEQTSEIWAFIS